MHDLGSARFLYAKILSCGIIPHILMKAKCSEERLLKSNENRHYTNKHFNYVNIIFYATALVIVLLLKLFYDKADNNQMLFILKPLSRIVSSFYNTAFSFDASIGFFSKQLGIAINHSCAGINYLLIIFSMLSFSFIHLLKTVRGKMLYFTFLFPISFVLSLLINSFRIIVSIMMQKADFFDEIVSDGVLHNLTGMLVFICFLLIINYVFSTILKKVRCTNEKAT